MSRKYDHIHKYQRVEFGGSRLPKFKHIRPPYIVYRCTHTNCQHFLPELMITGKESQCWGTCGGTLIITQEHITRKIVKPRCSYCKEEREKMILHPDLEEKEQLDEAV